MKQVINYQKKIIKVLESLNKTHSFYSIGKHMFTAFDGYNIENLSDKEFYNRLNDYYSELQSDIIHTDDVEDIIQQSKHLNAFDLLEEE